MTKNVNLNGDDLQRLKNRRAAIDRTLIRFLNMERLIDQGRKLAYEEQVYLDGLIKSFSEVL